MSSFNNQKRKSPNNAFQTQPWLKQNNSKTNNHNISLLVSRKKRERSLEKNNSLLYLQNLKRSADNLIKQSTLLVNEARRSMICERLRKSPEHFKNWQIQRKQKQSQRKQVQIILKRRKKKKPVNEYIFRSSNDYEYVVEKHKLYIAQVSHKSLEKFMYKMKRKIFSNFSW